ncbi:hypothetical protein D5P88_15860 [Salmonella enterica subsp. enterica]|nr:hypothetical protein [Salmonella enterica subsp. enterica]
MVKQKIEGNNNVQVGKMEGDVHIEHSAPIINPSDPDVVACPFKCGQLTWWNAPKCWNCGRPVLQYFEHQWRLSRKNTLTRRAIVLALMGFAMLFGGSYLPDGISGIIMVLGGFSLGAALLHGQAVDQLGGSS